LIDTTNREGDDCDRCKENKAKVGPIINYKENGRNDLFCKNCLEQFKKELNMECPKCGKVVGLSGLTEPDKVCYDCAEKNKNKELKCEKRKKFIKKYLVAGILITIGIIGLIIVG